jgi:Na+/H+ antiporter NhaC
MLKKWLVLVFRYAAPLLIVVFVVMAVYDKISPWEHAESVLKQYPESFSFLVGCNSKSHNRDGRWYKYEEKTYLVVKNDFSKSQTVKVSINTDGEVREILSDGGLVTFIVTFLLLVLIIWFSWSGYKVFTHNKRLQIDAAKPHD